MPFIPYRWRLGVYLLIALFFYTCSNEPTTKTDDKIKTQLEASEERLQLIFADIDKAELAGNNGQIDSAIFWYNEASKGWLALQNWDSLHATAIDALYLSYGFFDFGPVKPYLEKFTKLIPPELDTIKAKFLEIQGFIAYNEGDSELSLSFYKPMLPIWEKYQRDEKLAGVYNMLGILYHNLEDYPLAEQWYRESIRLGLMNFDSLTASNSYDNLGRALLQQGNWKEAIEYINKSYALMPSEDGFHEHNLALAYHSGGQHDKAIKLAHEALQKTSVFEEYNYLGLSEAYRTLGDVYMGADNFENAEKYYQLCLEKLLEETGGGHRDIARARINLGEAYQAKSLWNLAIREYHAAIQIFLSTFEPQSILDCPSRDSLFSREGYLMEALRYKGQCLLKKYEKSKKINELKAASQHFQTAIHFIHQTKLLHTETGAKRFYGENYSLPYLEDALHAQLRLYEVTQDRKHQEVAFELTQQATAFLLRESVNEQRAMEAAQVPEDTIELLNKLNARIVDIQSAIIDAESTAKVDSLQALMFPLKRSRLNLLEKMEVNYPKYFQLKHALKPIPLSQLQQNLGPDDMAIKYFIGKEQLYIFAFSQQSFEVFIKPLDNTFYQKTADFRKTLSDLDYLRKAPQEAEQLFLSSSHYLYQQLISPVLETFGEERISQLILIPDGILNYLSFECLLTQATDSWLDKEAYLLNDHTISYAYYAGLLLDDTDENSNKKSRFLGFGTEYDDQTLDKIGAMEQDSIANPQIKETFRDKVLSKLAYADDEVKEVASLLSGKSFLNEKATKTNFLKHSPQYEVVHVATHSFIDTENDSTAFIVFNQSDGEDDFLLSLAEVYGLQLNAELIALSGCQTGTGALQRSEGVMSLARAFRFAGSNSLIASQWSISDRASSIIMKEFYTQLKQGVSKDEALQQAKLRYLNNDELSSPAYRIPAYWGAMILIGDAHPIQFKPARSYIGWLLIAGIGLLALLIGWKYKRR